MCCIIRRIRNRIIVRCLRDKCFMRVSYILSDYIEQALTRAEYDKLEDNSFAGRIPDFVGVVAFGSSLRECENELRSTLEDWLLVGLKLGHSLPVVSNFDLNKKLEYESVESV